MTDILLYRADLMKGVISDATYSTGYVLNQSPNSPPRAIAFEHDGPSSRQVNVESSSCVQRDDGARQAVEQLIFGAASVGGAMRVSQDAAPLVFAVYSISCY